MPLKDAVLEIGCEEIPSSYIRPAMDQMRSTAQTLLAESRLSARAIRCYSTPRRLALTFEGLPEMQEDVVQEVTGPPVTVAFDAQGLPTRAGEGFARAQGVAVSALQRKTTPKGEVVSAVKRVSGRLTSEILFEVFPQIVRKVRFPKTMRWGAGDFLFARPIRWILAVFSRAVIPFEVAGLRADRVTYGLRVLKQGPLDVEDATRYLEILRGAGVLADPEERLLETRRLVEEAARSRGFQLIADAGLLQDVNNLLESPEAVSGDFDPAYLSLPSEVIVTAMREHQKFFAMNESDGRLAPGFITVINGRRERHDLIRKSNEAVLKARLEDAKFFWREDLKTPLAQWAEKLSGITWLEGQGTLADKAARVKKLVKALAPLAGVESTEVEQAALLAKADLATHMVREKEFNSLQGVMGGLYAKAQGLSPRTALAIGEHYRPRWSGDDLPTSLEGSILSVADKLDTLVGCFKAGLIPTGSQDPFALRRQGLGVLLIVLKNRWDVSLSDLVAKALAGYGGGRSAKLASEIEEFLRGRLQSVLEGRELAYDAIAAVLSAPGESLTSMVERVETVSRLKGTREFQELATAAGRVLRILPEKLPPPKPSKALLKLPEETGLFAAVQSATGGLRSAADAGRWEDVVGHLSTLTPAVHAFFEKILVMDKDPRVKRNRLALLSQAAGLYRTVCDFRKLVTPSENQGKPS